MVVSAYMNVLTNNMVSKRNEFFVVAGLCILGALLRTYQLGDAPLNSDETTSVMSAWRLVTDAWVSEPKSLIPASGLLHTLQVFTFWLGGVADARLGRICSAIAGSLFVLWPMLLRDWIGRDRALVAVGLQVISPVMWIVSRTGDGMSLTLICGLSIFAGWRKFCVSSDRWALKLAACGLGAGLAAGPHFLTIMFIVAVYIIFNFGIGKRCWGSIRPELNVVLVPALCTFVLVATAFFRYPTGISAAGESWSLWLFNWTRIVGDRHFALIPGLLMLHEGIFVVLALAGIWLLARRGERLRELVCVTVASVGFCLLYSGRQPGDVIWVLLPLTVLASETVVWGWRVGLRRMESFVSMWQVGAHLMIMGFGYMVVSQFAVGRGIRILPGDWDILVQVGGLGIISVLVVFLFTSAWSGTVARRAVIVTLTLSLVGCSFHSRTRLGAGASRVGLDFWHATRLSMGGRLLLDTLEDVSLKGTGQSREVVIEAIGQSSGQLGWLLREYPNVRWRSKLSSGITSPVVIVTGGVVTRDIEDRYYGQDFVDTVSRTGWPSDSKGWASYVIFGETLVEQTKMVLLIRSDYLLKDANAR